MRRFPRPAQWRIPTLLAAVVAAGPLLVAPTAAAQTHHAARTAFTTVNLVSDVAGQAPQTDPQVANAWGIALGPTTPLWVNNQISGVSILFAGGAAGVTKQRTVAVPNGLLTGIAFNDSSDFQVTGSGGTQPARFLFDNLAGQITAWNPTATPGDAVVEASTQGAVYTGLALWRTPLGNFLLAADFAGGKIDVFDSQFRPVTLPAGFFSDPAIPAGFTPYNVFTVGADVYVAYAEPSPEGPAVRGPGLGFLDRFTDFGQRLQRLQRRGVLNAPWGLAVAPASFGQFAGDLLVANLGDGRITALDPRSGRVRGQLRGTDGRPLSIDGLWGILPGTATTGGADSLWFSAGPDNETHGLVGLIRPAG
ncbi:MAG TPA: TIGR03118 family protein [Streptosporangiaceae bacterium]